MSHFKMMDANWLENTQAAHGRDGKMFLVSMMITETLKLTISNGI
jgi:hypothetical protein